MKASHVIGFILAIALIVFGIAFPTPEKHIRVSSYDYDNPWTDAWGEKYVGGDAYNYQMEASLKAGYMSGVLAMKSITFVGGCLLFFLTLYSNVKCAKLDAQTHALSEYANAVKQCGVTLDRIAANADSQKAMLKKLSAALDDHFTQKEESNVAEDMQ